MPLEERKRKLASIVKTGDALRYSDHFEEYGKALFDTAQEKGLEGIVAKRRTSCYEERRSSDWLKIKIRQTLECVVGGYTEPEGSRAHFGSLVLGLYDQEATTDSRRPGRQRVQSEIAGRNLEDIAEVRDEEESLLRRSRSVKKVGWVKPELVAEIEFTEWTTAPEPAAGQNFARRCSSVARR